VLATSAGVVQFDNRYDGYNLTNDVGDIVELNVNKGKIELFLSVS